MTQQRLFIAAAATCVLLIQGVLPASAQGQDWFVPGQGQAAHPGAPARAPRPGPRSQPQPQPQPGSALGAGGQLLPPQVGEAPEPNRPQLQVQLPPPVELPAIPKGTPPPAVAVGVLGVPDVMRASLAAQQIERVIGERRTKFNEDVQKEQASWREVQQSFAAQRASLNPEQIRAKERELQERITSAQRQFRDREQIIQDAARYALAQVERTMVGVIRQVAESRNMNLVLHRAQVALNVNELDITDEVTQELNKVLPVVQIPADGQPVPTVPVASATPPASATPASAAPQSGAPAKAAAAQSPASGPSSTPARKP